MLIKLYKQVQSTQILTPRVHRGVTAVFPLLSIILSPPRKYVRFVDWSFLCCFEMPCQVVCYPTSFLQAIQTAEASTGALPLTTARLSGPLLQHKKCGGSVLGSATSEGRPSTGESCNPVVPGAGDALSLRHHWAALHCHADVAGMLM